MDTQTPLFSICIPAFNCANYIDRAISSVLNQAFSSWELIIVDDCSSDNLEGALARLSLNWEKVKLIHLGRNCGPFCARRKAFEASSGRYIICLDADDCLNADALSKIYSVIKEYSSDVILFNMVSDLNSASCLIDYGRSGLMPGKQNSKTLIEVFGSSYSLNNLASKAIKRELLLPISPCPYHRLKMCEDRLEVLGVFQKMKTPYLLDEGLYVYYKNPNSTTNSKFEVEFCFQQSYVESLVNDYLLALDICPDSQYKLFIDLWISDFIKLAVSLNFHDLVSAITKLASDSFFVQSSGHIDKNLLRLDKRIIFWMLNHGYFGLCARLLQFLCSAKSLFS